MLEENYVEIIKTHLKHTFGQNTVQIDDDSDEAIGIVLTLEVPFTAQGFELQELLKSDRELQHYYNVVGQALCNHLRDAIFDPDSVITREFVGFTGEVKKLPSRDRFQITIDIELDPETDADSGMLLNPQMQENLAAFKETIENPDALRAWWDDQDSREHEAQEIMHAARQGAVEPWQLGMPDEKEDPLKVLNALMGKSGITWSLVEGMYCTTPHDGQTYTQLRGALCLDLDIDSELVDIRRGKVAGVTKTVLAIPAELLTKTALGIAQEEIDGKKAHTPNYCNSKADIGPSVGGSRSKPSTRRSPPLEG